MTCILLLAAVVTMSSVLISNKKILIDGKNLPPLISYHRRQAKLFPSTACLMWHKIEAFLAMNCKKCTATAASTAKSHLSNSAVKEVWHALKGWNKSPPVCPGIMINQTIKHMELYVRAHPTMEAALLYNVLHHLNISGNMSTN